MDLVIINDQGQQTSSLSASDETFGREYNEALVHQVVTAFMSNARSANSKQKDREEVRHSTKKPWRQKGTGRARAGMTSSPIWRGGGRTFPNTGEENYAHKVNRKMYRAGISAILSQLARDGKLKVVDSLGIDAPKTKALAQKVKSMGFDKVMIIADSVDENLWLSARNLSNVYVVEPHQADPWSLVKFGNVLITREAVKQFEEML
ncbi:50S ribosomal protein L4 [Betaproteobacteria bacterium SCN2]|jgi:large subunit ribosomal protein L4|nr:50S ribosomal protein L4 [Betaproteobacteria bacterium SCN2]